MKKTNIFTAKRNAAGVFVVSALASGSALADSAAAMTSISTEAGAMISAAWPIITTIVVAGIAMKLFKKFANKAS